jgi:hypothetical protein
MRSIATMPEALALAGISEDQLLDALLAGRVRSWVRYDWGETQDIPPADWRRVDIHWARSRVSTIQSGGAALFLYNTAVEIDQQTLLDHFGRASEREALKNVGGRPPKWDWEEFWLELCARLHDEGPPETQAEMIERMQQWFINRRGDHPADSEIKKRVSRLWHRLGLS